MANDPSLFEYSLTNIAVATVATNGARYQFSDRINGLTDDPGGSASVGKGSGKYPRYHVDATYEPTIAFTVPKDEHSLFWKWFDTNCPDGVCHVETRRTKKGQKTITDMAQWWQPLKGSTEYASGDGTMIELSGNYLEPKEDTTNALNS